MKRFMQLFTHIFVVAALACTLSFDTAWAMEGEPPKKRERLDPVLQSLSHKENETLQVQPSRLQECAGEQENAQANMGTLKSICFDVLGTALDYIPEEVLTKVTQVSPAFKLAARLGRTSLNLTAKSDHIIHNTLLDDYDRPRYPMLRNLDLSRSKVTDATIQKICNAYDKLEKLNLSDCTNLTNPTIIANNLTHLDLWWCTNLTNPTINANNLTHLNLSSCTNLTDATVRTITTNCPQLQKLKITDCTNLTNPTIIANNLTHLNFDYCINLTNATVRAIAINCPQLQEFNLYGCNLVTQATITGLQARGIIVTHYW